MKSKKRKKKSVTATILFADLMASSEFANILNLDEYDDYIEEFQSTVKNIFIEETENIPDECKQIHIRGDEGCLMLYSGLNSKDKSETEKIEDDVLRAIKIALRIKQEWLIRDMNINRIKLGKKTSGIGIGINTGKVVHSCHSSSNGDRLNVEGYPINLAKRIESQSRSGIYSGIFISEHAFNIYERSSGEDTLYFRILPSKNLKGIAQEVKLYELTCATLADYEPILEIPRQFKKDKNINEKIKILRESFNGTYDTLMGLCLCNYYWEKKMYVDSEEIARKMARIDPNYVPWKLLLAQILIDTFGEGEIRGEEEALLRREAKTLLENVVNAMSYHVDAHLDLGILYIDDVIDAPPKDKKAIMEKALDEFNIALRLDPDYDRLYYYKATALLMPDEISENHVDQAIDCLRKSVELNKENVEDIRKEKDGPFKKICNDSRFKEIIKGK